MKFIIQRPYCFYIFVWGVFSTEIQRQLEDVSSTKWSENGKMKDLVMKIHAYLRVEHDRLDGAVLELQEALGLVQSLLEERSKGKTKEILDNEYQEVFGHALDGILELLSKVLYEREETTKERKKCIDIICEELEIEKERPVFHIDAMIEEIIARYRNLVEQTQKELDVSNTLAKSAEERLYEIKEETDKSLSEKEEQIIKLESEILEKTAEVGEMKKSELSLVEEKDGWRDEAEKWRRRTEQIERTRRIGYYPGAYDSIYYDDSSYALKRKPNARWHKMDHELHGGHGNNVHRGSSLDSYSYRMMLDDYDETTRRIYLAKRKDQKRNVTKKQMTVANNKKEKKLPPESLASNDLGSLSLTPPLEDGKYLVEMGANDQQTVPYSKARNNKRDISKSFHQGDNERNRSFIIEEGRRLIKTKNVDDKSLVKGESFYWDDNYKTEDGVLMRGDANQLKRKSPQHTGNIAHTKQSKESNRSKTVASDGARKGKTESKDGKKEATSLSDGAKRKDQKGNASTSSSTTNKSSNTTVNRYNYKQTLEEHGQDSPYHSNDQCLFCNPGLDKH